MSYRPKEKYHEEKNYKQESQLTGKNNQES
jgi:hypothetical protein